jgi:hypothetical protein
MKGETKKKGITYIKISYIFLFQLCLNETGFRLESPFEDLRFVRFVRFVSTISIFDIYHAADSQLIRVSEKGPCICKLCFHLSQVGLQF